MEHLSLPSPAFEDIPPLPMDAATIRADFLRHFNHTLGRDRYCTSAHYYYESLALTLRDRLIDLWKNTQYSYEENNSRFAYYLSMEFLMGRTLGNAVLNLGIDQEIKKAIKQLGLVFEEMAESEHDAGLGNGGLGRLAACFLDSCANLRLPVMGYGIRYVYGMFRQRIENGYQIEEPDHWLRGGNPWEIKRPEFTQRIRFGGKTGMFRDHDGSLRAYWRDTQDVLAVPYDIPIPGYRNGIVNTLRLWSAAATDEFNLSEFNAGSYTEAVRDKNIAEHITMVLCPNDASENGKELRLRQQYFLASASLQDILRRWVHCHGRDFSEFTAKNCFQLNDTHPSCAIPELIRLLLDDYHLGWDEAWAITTRTMAYTNHTLLPEALERWPVRMFRQLIPRLLDIIFEINARFLVEVARRWPGDIARQQRLSLIEEGADPMVRMAYLAIVGSFSINGVAELHSRLLASGLFYDFHELWPEKFNNKTNGVTHRRWLAGCNPALAELITSAIGDEWICDLDQLSLLTPLADNADFRMRWRAVRRINKMRLANLVQMDCRVWFDTESLFDVQVKRIHEYKRQLLNCLHVIHLYDRIKRGDIAEWTPRCVLLGGKAAPGYRIAKRIIKLINNIALVINHDPEVGKLLRVAFLPDYRVSAMEIICPGTDLSEQISTAGKEASGTGNMKFMMNGAITIGTLDGANIEIRDAVGADNFFLFGLNAEEVEITRNKYNPNSIIDQDDDLARVIHLLESGHFSQFEPGIFQVIIDSLRSPDDPWMTIADFRSFVNTQRRAAAIYRDSETWTRMSIYNTAASGKFSTDRTISDYNREIWRLLPLPKR